MFKEKATIYDFARMCKHMERCEICPLDAFRNTSNSCFEEMKDNTRKVNEIILNWRKEYLLKTKQKKFLELQIPKKVIYEGYNDQDAILCPNCKAEVGWIDMWEHERDNYCSHCGQHLDWEE